MKNTQCIHCEILKDKDVPFVNGKVEMLWRLGWGITTRIQLII